MRDTTLMNCISACLECHRTCTEMASDHCLERGGPHVEPKHFRTMLACAEICGASAQMMMLQSPYHHALCMLCARICEDCADSCRALDGMEACVKACERCAVSCREMAIHHSGKDDILKAAFLEVSNGSHRD
jgi:hypothetical protein